MLYSKILSESHRLNEKIKALEHELSLLPQGNIFCVHDNNRIKWFQNDGSGAKYISKKKRTLAEQLANRKYLSLLLKDYLQEKKALDAYLKQ